MEIYGVKIVVECGCGGRCHVVLYVATVWCLGRWKMVVRVMANDGYDDCDTDEDNTKSLLYEGGK